MPIYKGCTEAVLELGKREAQVAGIWQKQGARDTHGFPEGVERKRKVVTFSQGDCVEEDKRRRRDEDLKSTAASPGLSSGAAGTAAFVIMGHALRYAKWCHRDGAEGGELIGCQHCGAYMAIGGRSGTRPRLKDTCPGARFIDKSGQNQRNAWEKGRRPGGQTKED